MMAFALSKLEKVLNRYLQLDLNTIQNFSQLENKIIEVQITEWNIDFFVFLHKNGISLSARTDNKADMTISGSLFDLCQAVCTKGKSSVLFENFIEISGDTEIGQKLRQIMVNIDIDWEERLSKITGDIIAHQIVTGVRHTVHFGKAAVALIRENIRDYLQAESQLVPTSYEVNSFIKSVVHLQYDVERTEIRIKNWLKGHR